MIVITLTSCPPKLRGDLSKWLCEINTGVYVGNLSARVRDGLWLRVCENLDNGKATMVYSTNNEQHLEFHVHNGDWIPVDFDGITLMKRPLAKSYEKEDVSPYYSKAGNWHRAAMRKAQTRSAAQQNVEIKKESADYVVIDIETTGLRAAEDEIIELAALRVVDGKEVGSFTSLALAEKRVSSTITQLTGITQEMLECQGIELEYALKKFLDFIGQDKILCHNLSFDMAFLQKACKKYGYPAIKNSSEDTVRTARKYINDIADYKLATLAAYYGLETQKHRALDDCRILFQIYEKILENCIKNDCSS